MNNQGQGLIGIIIVLVMASLITGGVYYYFQKQTLETSELTMGKVVQPEGMIPPLEEEKIKEETISQIKKNTPTSTIPTSTLEPIIQKCVDGTFYGQCSTNKPKYCENGSIVDKCSFCGCPEGTMCRDDDMCIKIERSEVINTGIIIFKYPDTILSDALYCQWPNSERTLAFEKCYDTNYGGEGKILSKYSLIDLITDSINKERVFRHNTIYSLYCLPDYFRKEASKYGLDLKVNLSFQGVFDLTESLPQTYKRPSGGLVLTDYSFFVNQAEKRIDLSSFDKLMIIFLNDQDFQDREEGFEFSSAYYQEAAILNFRIRGDLFSNHYLTTLSHEFQHVLGASDLYLEPCPRGNYWSCCMDPAGIPEPTKVPKYPQSKACSMCQSIALNADGEGQAPGFEDVVICPETAKEMGWLK